MTGRMSSIQTADSAAKMQSHDALRRIDHGENTPRIHHQGLSPHKLADVVTYLACSYC